MLKGKVVSKDTLLTKLYDGLHEPEPKIIDVFICKLRDKFNNATKTKDAKKYIVTVWGQGYMLTSPQDLESSETDE